MKKCFVVVFLSPIIFMSQAKAGTTQNNRGTPEENRIAEKEENLTKSESLIKAQTLRNFEEESFTRGYKFLNEFEGDKHEESSYNDPELRKKLFYTWHPLSSNSPLNFILPQKEKHSFLPKTIFLNFIKLIVTKLKAIGIFKILLLAAFKIKILILKLILILKKFEIIALPFLLSIFATPLLIFNVGLLPFTLPLLFLPLIPILTPKERLTHEEDVPLLRSFRRHL